MRTKDLPELILDARDGDRGAFDEIVRRTYADTFSLAHRLTGNAEDAGDVAQETYIRAFRYLQRFRGDAQFSTWLYRITTNCASTHLGRMRRHRHDELRADSPVADDNPEFDPALRADASAMRDEVQRALRRLPERLRAVVVLRDVHDLSHNAIATELGITETAAKVRLHRARVRLRELVLDRRTDSDSTDAGTTAEVRKSAKASAPIIGPISAATTSGTKTKVGKRTGKKVAGAASATKKRPAARKSTAKKSAAKLRAATKAPVVAPPVSAITIADSLEPAADLPRAV